MLMLDAHLQQVGQHFDGVGPLVGDVGQGVAAQATSHAYLIIYIVLGCTYLVIGEACVEDGGVIVLTLSVHFIGFMGAKIGQILQINKKLGQFIAFTEIIQYLCGVHSDKENKKG